MARSKGMEYGALVAVAVVVAAVLLAKEDEGRPQSQQRRGDGAKRNGAEPKPGKKIASAAAETGIKGVATYYGIDPEYVDLGTDFYSKSGLNKEVEGKLRSAFGLG